MYSFLAVIDCLPRREELMWADDVGVERIKMDDEATEGV